MTIRTRLLVTAVSSVLLTAVAVSWAVESTTASPKTAAPVPVTTKANAPVPAASNAQNPYTKLVQDITHGQVQVQKQFAGPGDLVGLVVQSPQGEKAVIYVDKNAQYVIVGNVITADGQSRTSSDTEQYVNSEIAQKAWGNAANTAWVLDGSADAKHIIYAVGDPNCSACHKFYSDTRTYVANGDLAIRWIWVGFLRPSSPGMAMAIMNAKDPSALLKQNESQFNESKEQGGIQPINNPEPALKAKFDGNMKFMSDHQFTVTPVIIYKDDQGKAHTVMGALPEPQLKQLVNSAVGKP